MGNICTKYQDTQKFGLNHIQKVISIFIHGELNLLWPLAYKIYLFYPLFMCDMCAKFNEDTLIG